MFQSSPTPKGGRYILYLDLMGRVYCFNPRPPRKVGATCNSRTVVWSLVVSILAHPERWALLGTPKRKRSTTWFQSSPTPKGGRYVLSGADQSRTRSFNPRPPRKVGATVHVCAITHRLHRFNPRPPRKVGATSHTREPWQASGGFNPRPPRKVGATDRAT